MERYEDDEAIETIIGDAAYHEIRRLEGRDDDSARRGLENWRGVIRRIGRMSSEGKHETLRGIRAAHGRPMSRATSIRACTSGLRRRCPGC